MIRTVLTFIIFNFIQFDTPTGQTAPGRRADRQTAPDGGPTDRSPRRQTAPGHGAASMYARYKGVVVEKMANAERMITNRLRARMILIVKRELKCVKTTSLKTESRILTVC